MIFRLLSLCLIFSFNTATGAMTFDHSAPVFPRKTGAYLDSLFVPFSQKTLSIESLGHSRDQNSMSHSDGLGHLIIDGFNLKNEVTLYPEHIFNTQEDLKEYVFNGIYSNLDNMYQPIEESAVNDHWHRYHILRPVDEEGRIPLTGGDEESLIQLNQDLLQGEVIRITVCLLRDRIGPLQECEAY